MAPKCPILIFILYSYVALVNAEHDGIIRIPLGHMESGLQRLFRSGADLKLIEGIYDMYRKADNSYQIMMDGKPIPTNDTLPLFKYFDTEYYGLVNIGKPGKQFKMIMDTAWGYSWVLSSDCPRSLLSCAVHEKYNHKQSSTYIPDNTPFNISNRYVGYMSKDSFLVGQMTTTNQTFAELTKLPWLFTLYGSDGTIGLGFKELSPNYTPFFYNMFGQHKLKNAIFSFYINRDPTTKHGGSLFFGGIDTRHNKTEFTPINIVSNSYWQFKINKVSVVISKKSKVDFCKNGCLALADTSSNTISGPMEEIKEINRLIGADTRVFFSNRYLIPCIQEHKGPKVSFFISGKEFQINGRDYIQKLSYSGITICLSAFTYDPDLGENWILGGAFLYQYYTAYDVANRQIMIAEVN